MKPPPPTKKDKKKIYMVRFKARQQFMTSSEKQIFCGGHCVKSIYPREKVKYVPDR